MRILFKTLQLPKEQLPSTSQADYMSDLLFHGLRSIFGERCVDIPKKDYMYDTYPEEHTKNLWGRGFTYSRTLEDISVDRNATTKDFDFIVFSIHHSVHFNYDLQCREFLALGKKPEDIAVVDGHDWSQYNKKLAHISPIYFKRELDHTCPKHIFPIWFAMPKNKIIDYIPEKSKDFAYIHPGGHSQEWPEGSRQTHSYTNEHDYYQDYQDSKFAFTCKKGGWDCMRHLEIICNGCIPLFTDIDYCPPRTCMKLPKKMLSKYMNSPTIDIVNINRTKGCFPGHELVHHKSRLLDSFDNDEYNRDLEQLFCNRVTFTTEYLAEYFVDMVKGAKYSIGKIL